MNKKDKLELLVFIKSSGVNVNVDNLEDTLTTFIERNPGVNYKFYLVIDEGLKDFVESYFKDTDLLFDLKITDNSWAHDFNEFFSNHTDDSEWLLVCHDDVYFVTHDWFKKITAPLLSKKEELGWVTSTSEYYYKYENTVVTDTFRPGFHLDHKKWGAMWQLHKCRINIEDGKILDVDYPKYPVKIHGPMSAVMLTPMESMKKIGPCADWTQYTMLVDEDWSLEALRNNLWNVWVPDVHHLHPSRKALRKANNRWQKEAHEGFAKKWGFLPSLAVFKEGDPTSLAEVREKYSDTNIAWSSYRNSYDWERFGD
jgi:hypothetical protein